jgi:hypothetical protein
MPRKPRSLGVALLLAAAAFAAPAWTAAQAIYRCDDGKGGVVYTDVPCRGGAKVDVAPGRADPAAIARLERERKAFDERHAAREARLQAEAQAAREAQRAKAVEPQAATDAYPPYPPWAWGGSSAWPPRPPRPPTPPLPPRPPEPAPYVPAKPASPLGR